MSLRSVLRRCVALVVVATVVGIAEVQAVGVAVGTLNVTAGVDSHVAPCRLPSKPAMDSSEEPPGALMRIFENASQEFQVPVDVLIVISFIETRWQHYPKPSLNNTYGVMGLQRSFGDETAPLKLASELIGLPEDSLKASVKANVRGAAALLAHEFVQLHGDFDRTQKMLVLENWRVVMRRYTRYYSGVFEGYFEEFCDYLRSRGFGVSTGTVADSTQAK